MQVTETLMGDEARGGVGFLSERARELDDVVSRNRPMFFKRAFRYLGNAPDAEDAVQDALLSACKHLSQFRGQAQMSSWLTAIVINAARNHLRRRHGIHLSIEQPYGEDTLTLSERLPDLKPSPEQVCCATDAQDRLSKAVNQLSPTQRRAFQLRDIDGLTTKEAALVLGVPEGTVKSQLARARARIARIIRMKAGRSLVPPSGPLDAPEPGRTSFRAAIPSKSSATARRGLSVLNRPSPAGRTIAADPLSTRGDSDNEEIPCLSNLMGEQSAGANSSAA
ncbi:MAG TPA: sigma-70 family RNA polymerase sigma factor [Verrucomicrobiae bacterium]|jgi:RNA polymerase sigma-70 factor (ECF subfamily)|nr:sigma-70 family RNA polymerase sigma factor [Verrucomicrobiae bacterium]